MWGGKVEMRLVVVSGLIPELKKKNWKKNPPGFGGCVISDVAYMNFYPFG